MKDKNSIRISAVAAVNRMVESGELPVPSDYKVTVGVGKKIYEPDFTVNVRTLHGVEVEKLLTAELEGDCPGIRVAVLELNVKGLTMRRKEMRQAGISIDEYFARVEAYKRANGYPEECHEPF